MTLKYIKIFVIIILILLGLSNCDSQRSSKYRSLIGTRVSAISPELNVGFASVNITPPIGMRLCGTFDERLSVGVHDSLYVRAFVFKQGDTKFAIAGCDLAMMFPVVCDKVRTKIRSLGFPAENVMIHASETHNGPDYIGEFRDVFHKHAIEKYGYDPAEPIDYSEFLIDKISKAIEEADKVLKPSEIFFISGKCKGIAFYRRFKMKDGSIGWNPGKLNPEIVEPMGPTDQTLPVLSIYQEGKTTPSALLTGFAMHLAILNDAYYGADYPYYLGRKLAATISPDLFTYFIQAPCCEVNHIDVSTDEPQTGHQWAQVVGDTLASLVEPLIEKNNKLLSPKLSVRSKIVSMDLQKFSDDEIDKQRKIWYSDDRTQLPFLEVVYAGKVTGIYDQHQGRSVPALIQVFQFDNETVLIGLPSEVSVELGLSIREKSPFQNTMMVQLSNDWFGYIPPKHIFDEGNYEAVVAKISPGEGEKLVDETLNLLNTLKTP
jgi:neutral ceramidase